MKFTLLKWFLKQIFTNANAAGNTTRFTIPVNAQLTKALQMSTMDATAALSLKLFTIMLQMLEPDPAGYLM